MDHSLKSKIGNLVEDDCFSIFGSPGMARLHVENARPDYGEKSICKSCSRAVRHELADQRQLWRVARG
jgi:hypothetical protein